MFLNESYTNSNFFCRYYEKSKSFTAYDGIIDNHLESNYKSKFQGAQSIQKRRLEVDRYDYASPADAYGTGYNYNINAQRQTIVDPRVSHL